jgi:hypothetical protein
MQSNTPKGIYCCVPPTPGRRMLTFPDGSQVGVMGLNEILADVYAEGRQVSEETAEEIVERLSEKNYITPSFRQQYCDLLMDEYRKYLKSRDDNTMK